MQTRNYKICDGQNKITICLTKDEVKRHLNEISKGDSKLMNRVEIFDPVTGWDYAANWLTLKAQRKN